MSKRNIYALLVAIDDYPIDRHKLNGCVNDMRAFESYLTSRFDPEKVNLHLKVLTNEQATRNNVIDGFMTHLMQATGFEDGKSKDLAVFYFSGHGAQEPMPWELHKTDEKKLIQSIVCYDSRLEGGNDLVNKELGYLIHKVKTKGKSKPPAFVAIMDCCHSGSGTRSTGDSTKSRQMDLRKKNRQIEQYLGYEERSETKNDAGKAIINFPYGSHLLLAAARSHETAKETKIDGAQRGVFTYALIKALKDAKNDISYEDLIYRTQVFAFNKVDDQLPQLDIVGDVDPDAPFLGGGMAIGEDQYKVEWKDIRGWHVNAGSLQGIPIEQDERKPTTFRLYPAGLTTVEMNKVENSVGKATVMDTDLDTATLIMPSALERDKDTAYVAVVEDWGSQPMMVYLDGESEGLSPLKSVLGAAQNGPAFIGLTADQANADYRVFAHKGKYSITTTTDNRPVAREAKGYNQQSAINVANDLECISRWKTGLAFTNPDTDYSTFPLKVEVFKVLKQVGGAGKVEEEVLMEGTQHELQCKYVHGAWEPYKFRLRITNTQDEIMHVGILYFSGRFGIQYMPMHVAVSQDLHGNKTRAFTWVKELQPNETIWVMNGNPITADLKGDYADAGLTEGLDILKIVASTDRFNFDKFKKQAGLKLPVLDARASLDYDEDSEFYEEDDFNFLAGDWTTQEHFVKTIKPLPLKPFSWNTKAELWARVEVHQNNVVSGMASLATAEQAIRGIGRSIYPPAVSEKFEMEAIKFTQGWNTDRGLAVLELFEVKGLDEIAENNPLKITLTDRVPDVKQVVAIGTDGKTFQLLGKTEGRTIHLTQLPKASTTISEKLPDSHKIVFIRILPKDGVSYEAALKALEDGLSLLG
ncbi:MAG: caspase family protein [Flammeovirgaceae bacterium]